MFYYNLKRDSFTNFLTLYEFGSDKPYFSELLFGTDPLIEHLPSKQFQMEGMTLILERETGSWCFLDNRETDLYRGINKMTLSNAGSLFPEEIKPHLTDFIIKLYWLGLIRLGHQRFIAPDTFERGPVTRPGPLFILHITDCCNLSCSYCFTDSKPSGKKRMSWETARRALDLILEFPSDSGTIEFSGGEPLLEFKLLRAMVEYIAEKSIRTGKNYRFNLQSNGTLITKEIADFFSTYNIELSLSLDGDEILNNATRRFPSKKGSYKSIIKGMEIIGQGRQNFGLICVISRKNAGHIRQILDHFRSLGFVRVKINPVSKLGRAFNTWDELSVGPDEFLHIHKEYLKYVIEDSHPVIDDNTYFMLGNIGQKMHSYRCMRSQCGAGYSFFSIDPEGDIFPCDRYRDKDCLNLGNVRNAPAMESLASGNKIVKKLSHRLTEKIELCRECDFKRLCEGGCTYETYYHSGKINVPHPWCSYFKEIYQELFKAISKDKSIISKMGIGADIYNRSIFTE